MRLITRSDFDGLVCAVFLKEVGMVKEYTFAHPKDIQDGLIEVTHNDVLANVPYVEGCGFWFDHHSSEEERKAFKGKYKGVSKSSPSAAHVIYDYFGGAEKFPRFADILNAVDKVDSANLTITEILNPYAHPWILLGFIMDPRTGLGRYKEFALSNYQLIGVLVDACRTMTIEEILELPDVAERVELYREQTALFIDMVKRNTVVEEGLIITDLRAVDPIWAGNRFMIYSLYPDQNLSAWIVSGKEGRGCSLAVGYSTINRTAKVDVGSLMLKYNGGGHKVVGTCQFSHEEMEEKLPEALRALLEQNR